MQWRHNNVDDRRRNELYMESCNGLECDNGSNRKCNTDNEYNLHGNRNHICRVYRQPNRFGNSKQRYVTNNQFKCILVRWRINNNERKRCNELHLDTQHINQHEYGQFGHRHTNIKHNLHRNRNGHEWMHIK